MIDAEVLQAAKNKKLRAAITEIYSRKRELMAIMKDQKEVGAMFHKMKVLFDFKNIGRPAMVQLMEDRSEIFKEIQFAIEEAEAAISGNSEQDKDKSIKLKRLLKERNELLDEVRAYGVYAFGSTAQVGFAKIGEETLSDKDREVLRDFTRNTGDIGPKSYNIFEHMTTLPEDSPMRDMLAHAFPLEKQ